MNGLALIFDKTPHEACINILSPLVKFSDNFMNECKKGMFFEMTDKYRTLEVVWKPANDIRTTLLTLWNFINRHITS